MSATRTLRQVLTVALLAVELGTAPAVHAQGGGTVRIRPATLTLAAGGSGTVEVWLEDAAAYYGLDLRLAWDPAVVTAAEAQAAPLWEVFDAGSHIVLKNCAGRCSDGSGRSWDGAWYAVANVNPAPAFSGSGRVCTLRLTGLAPGSTALAVTAEGATESGARLNPAGAGATIVVILATVTATPTATATATPTPTSTATPTATTTPTPACTATITPTPTRTATATRPSTRTATAPAPSSRIPPRAPATPWATPSPHEATAVPPPTRTGTPAPTPTASPNPGDWLVSILLPFLLGALVTAGVLRMMRGVRRG